MKDVSRRAMLTGGTAFAAAAALSGEALTNWAKAWAQTAPWKPEAGAKINLLRWKRFVEAEDAAFMKMVAAFKNATGVEVSVTNESFEDVQPKASVAANTGSGLDMVWGLYSLPHLFPQKCLDVSDVADYLGKKYGGWLPAAEAYGKVKGKWIAIPMAFNGGYMNYRVAAMNKAGFSKFPEDLGGFLELCRGLKKNNTPAGFAMGHATGDANSWIHWALWSHDAYLVDANEKIVINSPETAKALDYVKSLYETFIPGTVSWNDSSNNKAFLSGELYLTNNGISIYASAKTERKDIAEDMDHAAYPVGKSGKPTEFQLAFPILAYTYTKAPNACKAFMAFALEAQNYNAWLEAAQGYLCHPLRAYANNPIWTKDPKNKVFGEASTRTLAAGGLAPVSEKVAAVLADFVIVDMFASYCTGREDAKGAIRNAERQAQRIFRQA